MADAIRALSERVGAHLLARGDRLVVAESCTGGWICKALTDIAGSSQWLAGGLVVYSNACKERWLGVRAETLAAHGAVSEAVVREMAQGALAAIEASVAVAVSGIAGPAGGTPEKPVGTVWIAWGRAGGAIVARHHRFPGGREAVRRAAVAAALEGLLDA